MFWSFFLRVSVTPYHNWMNNARPDSFIFRWTPIVFRLSMLDFDNFLTCKELSIFAANFKQQVSWQVSSLLQILYVRNKVFLLQISNNKLDDTWQLSSWLEILWKLVVPYPLLCVLNSPHLADLDCREFIKSQRKKIIR